MIFRPKSQIQSFFPPKIRWSPKKKKKKGLHQNWDSYFVQIQTFEGGCFRMGGGLFSIFHRKSASKAQKGCDFAYFTSQWGGSRPPRPAPGYATECMNQLLRKSKPKTTLPQSIETEGKLIISPQNICNEINKYFIKIGKQLAAKSNNSSFH